MNLYHYDMMHSIIQAKLRELEEFLEEPQVKKANRSL